VEKDRFAKEGQQKLRAAVVVSILSSNKITDLQSAHRSQVFKAGLANNYALNYKNFMGLKIFQNFKLS
jgi:hypothetical protein